MASKRAFVMGHPIAHSRSPMLHGYWLKLYGIDGSYEALDIAPDEIPDFFAGFREAGWAGGNVTVPHKMAVIPYLSRIDENARAMGAVNTIWWDGEDLVGGNADSLGFMGNLDDRAPGWDHGAKKAVVLGAGGAARAVVWGLKGRGLNVVIVNRTKSKADDLAAHFGGRVASAEMGALGHELAEADILVNATSLGMVGQPHNEVDLSTLKPTATVADIVYVPLETQLLKQAAVRGHRTVDGLGMLLHQAVFGFRHWFGTTPEVTEELREMIMADIRAKTKGA